MSRLFDALKSASRFREDSDAAAGEEVWQALGLNGAEAPPVREIIHEEEEARQPAVAVIEQPSPIPFPQPISPETAPPATTATVVLDRRAKLIPNAISPAVMERYRMLRTKILQEREKTPFRSLVVTSANPQEGKTVTVLNLALSFATLPSFKVLVVDGDMRRGTLGSWLGVDDDRIGLSNLVEGSAQLSDVILKSDEIPMDFILRGNSGVRDLQASQYAARFREMMEQYDLVLVDSPPVNLITDVQLIASSCDAVLLVARAFSTSRKSLEDAVQNLQPFRIIGTVLNAAQSKPIRRYSGYYG